eukprot:TRINITY_DN48060_c0_g1_i1.p1 TRINITY_DN48060_c0_g1~~TRINITY_DN48060_c0_g1_i1.p1  ORF type:complete len:158 (+),score=36.85 TRINITY_DN48060_c0_g1_i1:84-557(+)
MTRGPAPVAASSEELRSKGLLPAIGVGTAVYLVTGVVSLSTLGLVGIGAGVGYGVGTWIADKYQEKQDAKNGGQDARMDQLPWAIQVSLQSWQGYLASRAAGGPLNPQQVEQIFQEFARQEPAHAQNVAALVSAGSDAASQPAAGQPNIVPVVAAEV